MSDIPTKTYPPSFLHALIADHEAAQAGATPEESLVIATPAKTYCRETAEMIKHWNRRERYRGAIVALRDTLVGLQGGQPVSTRQMRDRMVELLDALLDVGLHGQRVGVLGLAQRPPL